MREGKVKTSKSSKALNAYHVIDRLFTVSAVLMAKEGSFGSLETYHVIDRLGILPTILTLALVPPHDCTRKHSQVLNRARQGLTSYGQILTKTTKLQCIAA